MAREIPLTKGLVAIVDDDDFEWLSQWCWQAQVSPHTTYANRGSMGREPRIGMHRLIMDAPEGMVVDHINGNGLDNRRQNLRVCTTAENLKNRRRQLNSPHAYKGIYYGDELVYQRRKRFWYAKLVVDGKVRRSPPFLTAEGAAFEWDLMAIEAHGEFAKINFPHLHPRKPSGAPEPRPCCPSCGQMLPTVFPAKAA